MKLSRFVPIAAAMLIVACAAPPKQEIDQAKASMDAARTAQAADYAPADWNTVSDLDSKLSAELEAQDHKSAMFRSYGTAKQIATDLKTAADKATQNAASGKELAKKDAEDLMAKAKDARAKADAALKSAPHGKGTEADLASLKSDAAGTDATLDEMQKAYDAGDYMTAKAKAQAIITACDQVTTQVQSARAQKSRT